MKEVVKRTEAHLVFLTLNAGVVRCVMSPGLAPRVVNGTSHRGKVEMGYHTFWNDPSIAAPSHAMHPLCSEGVFFSPGLRSSLMVDLCWLPQVGCHYLCSHSKNHSRKYLSHFHDICILLCRDIGLAAKSFLLSRSKCQVWFSQQAQLNGLPSTSSHK